MKKIRLCVAGGGTGGHVFPIRSLLEHIDAEENFHARIDHVFWSGSQSGLEGRTHEAMECQNISSSFLSICSGKFRRQKTGKAFLQNMRDLFYFSFGLLQSLYLIQKNSIDVVFSKGGYVALPMVLAAAFRGKKIVVHESDTKMGLANRFAAKYASLIFTAFPSVCPGAIVSGQILSEKLFLEEDADDLALLLGTQVGSKKTKLLVMGGSQGARGLYRSLAQSLEAFPDLFSSIHITIVLGLLNKEEEKLFAAYDNISILDFCSQEQLGMLYRSHDIALTRGGTTSLAEQKMFDMLLCIVPLPWTHDQQSNGLFYEKTYGDILLQQDDELPDQLGKVMKALTNYKKKKNLTQNAGERVKEIKDNICQELLS